MSKEPKELARRAERRVREAEANVLEGRLLVIRQTVRDLKKERSRLTAHAGSIRLHLTDGHLCGKCTEYVETWTANTFDRVTAQVDEKLAPLLDELQVKAALLDAARRDLGLPEIA